MPSGTRAGRGGAATTTTTSTPATTTRRSSKEPLSARAGSSRKAKQQQQRPDSSDGGDDDQRPQRVRDQAQRRDQAGAASMQQQQQQFTQRWQQGSEDEESASDSDMDEQAPYHAEQQQRGRSHAAAAAGPSSSAAAATRGRGRKRGAAQAAPQQAQDPLALLPADLDEEALIRLRQALPPRNRLQKRALLQAHRAQFPRWRFLLRQRFSLLFYGFGSKRSLLETFAGEALTDGGVLAINGLHPSTSAKHVLQAAAAALTHRSCKSLSHSELLGLIEGEPACRQLYIVLHNIDGPGLRGAEEQLWLSRLSQAPAVRLAASVDHVNGALLWNSRVAAAFNWLWLDATSYGAYEAETAGVAPIITSCKQSAAKRGATTVLSTLVSSAREVFRLLATAQLDDPAVPGVAFPALLRLVRERFVLNSEQALKSTLAEFRDHELIKLRPGPDGGDVMHIPLEEGALRAALAEMEGGGGAAS